MLSASVDALTPSPPNVSREFDPQSEASVRAIASQSVGNAFHALAKQEFVLEPDLLHKAVYEAFLLRRAEAITLALRALRQEAKPFEDEVSPNDPLEMLVARAICEVFAEESAVPLLNLYETGDMPTRSNIIRAAGNIADEGAIRRLLVKALEDTSESVANGGGDGAPGLRICDLAYNQLVLRYDVRGVLRTIRGSQTMDIRDYHIELLRAKLAEGVF